MRVLSAVFAAALLCVPAAWPAPQLSGDALRRLIVMEDVEAASLVAEQVEWLAGGGMLVSGWQRWPDKPAFAAFDCPDVRLPAQLRPAEFFPYFALLPPSNLLAYWRSAGPGADCQLTPVDLRTGVIAPLGQPRTFASTGRLVTLGDGTVIASCQPEGGGGLLLKTGRDGRSTVLAEFGGQVCDGLVVEPDGQHVVAKCVGETEHYYRISVLDGLQAEVVASHYELYDYNCLPAGVQVDDQSRLVRTVGGGEDVILATDVEAVCSHPRSGGLIYESRGGLWVVSLDGGVKRELPGAEPPEKAQAHMFSWSPCGVYLAHCYQRNYGGTVRRAALGTEEVKLLVLFPASSRVQAGDRVWLAERFYLDEQGSPREPVWGTLKALLRAEGVAASEEGLVVATVSEGVEARVVERLTGSNEAPKAADESHISIGTGPQLPTTWVQTFTAEPLPGLKAWVKGDTTLGSILSVTVTRRRLTELE